MEFFLLMLLYGFGVPIGVIIIGGLIYGLYSWVKWLAYGYLWGKDENKGYRDDYWQRQSNHETAWVWMFILLIGLAGAFIHQGYVF